MKNADQTEISEQVAIAISKGQEDWKQDARFVELEAFCEEMKRLGIAKKPEYTASPLDTVGRGLFQAIVGRLPATDVKF